MTVTIVTTYKTRKAAERMVADYNYQDTDHLNFRAIKRDGLYYVVRDPHPSDEARSYRTMEVSA